LSTRLKEKEEKILQLLAALAEESAKGTPIVVEGKKDVDALRAVGVAGAVLTVKTGGKSFLDAVCEIEKSGVSEVILFLDFDRRGKEGTKRLKRSLERAKIKPNVKFWRALAALVGKEIQCIESLTAYLHTMKQKAKEKSVVPKYSAHHGYYNGKEREFRNEHVSQNDVPLSESTVDSGVPNKLPLYRAVNQEDYEQLAEEASRAVARAKPVPNMNTEGEKQPETGSQIPLPKLDDETFNKLVEEAKKPVPQLPREWTDDDNYSPAVTLKIVGAKKKSQKKVRTVKLPEASEVHAKKKKTTS
jgi:5S rRNA maturation endonuclease (ribonuclease M5)